MRLFVDSSGWTALYNPRDKYRARARTGIQLIAGQEVEFITTDYVLDETITNLQSGYSHAAAEKFGIWVLQQETVQIERITEAIWDEAWALFQQYDDKDFSFTDCTSFVVMQRHKLRDVFSFDHHFEQMGFRLWPQ
jgi:predicted nucleic acid-binding protein